MPSLDVYQTILDAAEGVVSALALEEAPRVTQRMLPVAREEIDTLPAIFVCPSETPEEERRLSAEDDAGQEVVYSVDVVAVAANENDYATHQRKYLRWREQLRQAFRVPRMDEAPTVYQTEIRGWAPLDRRKLNETYLYSGFTLRFFSAEAR